MEREAIRDQVIEQIHEVIYGDVKRITEEAYLMEDLDIDSLEALDIMVQLEEFFQLTIEEEALKQFVQVKDVIDYLESTINKN